MASLATWKMDEIRSAEVLEDSAIQQSPSNFDARKIQFLPQHALERSTGNSDAIYALFGSRKYAKYYGHAQ